MTHRLIITVVALLLWGGVSLASAQNSIVPNISAPSLTCDIDVPARGMVALPLALNAKISWCQESDNATIGYNLIITAIGSDKLVRTLYNENFSADSCVMVPPMYQCVGTMPEEAVTLVNAENRAGTTVAIRLDSPDAPAPNLDSPEELLTTRNLVRAVTVTGCQYTPPSTGVAETRPVNTAIGGVMTGTLAEISTRVGQLRRDGWRVEWQLNAAHRVTVEQPFQLVAMFWCVGVAQ